MPEWVTFDIDNPEQVRLQIIMYAGRFEHFALLDSCRNSVYGKPTFDLKAGLGVAQAIESSANTAWQDLKAFRQLHSENMFGYLSFELKNAAWGTSSDGFDGIGLPDMVFFIPQINIQMVGNKVQISDVDGREQNIMDQILQELVYPLRETEAWQISNRVSKEDYLKTVSLLHEHIASGDIYEINYCHEFYHPKKTLEPIDIYRKLSMKAKAPFSVFFRWGQRFLLCASPERFLKKEGLLLQSQPIKGTKARGEGASDKQAASDLLQSEKDLAEHVMIVDLVRNDLTPYARTGSVKVPELFGLYSFETVHHLVSNIQATLFSEDKGLEALQQAFPMGSMTGAPKRKVLELIETYEATQRGLYSGAFGYFTPQGDYDFNVVIRSILYNADTGYVSVQAGGAIVHDSDPEKEFAETVLKASALFEVLGATFIER